MPIEFKRISTEMPRLEKTNSSTPKPHQQTCPHTSTSTNRPEHMFLPSFATSCMRSIRPKQSKIIELPLHSYKNLRGTRKTSNLNREQNVKMCVLSQRSDFSCCWWFVGGRFFFCRKIEQWIWTIFHVARIQSFTVGIENDQILMSSLLHKYPYIWWVRDILNNVP